MPSKLSCCNNQYHHFAQYPQRLACRGGCAFTTRLLSTKVSTVVKTKTTVDTKKKVETKVNAEKKKQEKNREDEMSEEMLALKEEIEKEWRLVLHDDPIHTIEEVVQILNVCCPMCSPSRSYEVTIQVHLTGSGTVVVSNKKIVDEYCAALQAAGLTASVAPEESFEMESIASDQSE